MRRKQGFTLVELLVVMAIIAILAAIVVPNASKFIARARVTRALAEVTGAETAIMAMVTDAGRSNLGQVFGPGAVPAFVIKGSSAVVNGVVVNPIAPADWAAAVTNLDHFKRIMELYSSVTYDLLRYGRDVLRTDNGTVSDAKIVINNNMLSKLGTSYMDLGNDPWGGSYNIFPGPWKYAKDPATGNRCPIIFRRFSVDTSGTSKRKVADDGFSLKGGALGDLVTGQFSGIVEDAETWPDKVGFPADAGKSVYIWSLGENARTAQLLYSTRYGTQAGDAMSWYTNFDGPPQDGRDLGGGDDVNNWDKDATWARFTN